MPYSGPSEHLGDEVAAHGLVGAGPDCLTYAILTVLCVPIWSRLSYMCHTDCRVCANMVLTVLYVPYSLDNGSAEHLGDEVVTDGLVGARVLPTYLPTYPPV